MNDHGSLSYDWAWISGNTSPWFCQIPLLGELSAQLSQVVMVVTCSYLCPVKESSQYLAERGVLGESALAIGSMERNSGPGGGPDDHHLSFHWLWPERGLVNQHLTWCDVTCLPTELGWLCWSPADYPNAQPGETYWVVSPWANACCCGHCSRVWILWRPLASCETARLAPTH